jgi:hypothetical protein
MSTPSVALQETSSEQMNQNSLVVSEPQRPRRRFLPQAAFQDVRDTYNYGHKKSKMHISGSQNKSIEVISANNQSNL